MGEDKKIKKKISFRQYGPWIFPVALAAVSIQKLFDPDSPQEASILFLAAALIISPPAKTLLQKYCNRAVTFISRFILFITLTGFGINALTDARDSGFKSSEREQLFITIMEEDFTNSRDNAPAMFQLQEWLGALEVEGIVSANTILDDFQRNEVSATQKYKGAWLIEGRVTAINNSFNNAVVSLGNTQDIFNFNAYMDNKERAASYGKGQRALVYCTGIHEAVTLIRGKGCVDYRDWKYSAIKHAASNFRNKKTQKASNIHFHNF